MGEAERGNVAPRVVVSYFCENAHETRPSFSIESGAQAPDLWDCTRCGCPAGQDRENPPSRRHNEPYKTHLAYVKERRTPEDGDALLAEALATLRARRGR